MMKNPSDPTEMVQKEAFNIVIQGLLVMQSVKILEQINLTGIPKASELYSLKELELMHEACTKIANVLIDDLFEHNYQVHCSYLKRLEEPELNWIV